MIFSSHQLDLVERLCDAVAIVDHGRLVAAGEVEELRSKRAGRRWRVEVRGADGEWATALAGVRAVGDNTYELDPATDSEALLDAARAAGSVIRFGPEVPTLAELFRDVVGRERLGGSPMTNRRAVFLTARREVRELLRSRAFRISTAIQLAIVVAIVVISGLTAATTRTSSTSATSARRRTGWSTCRRSARRRSTPR